MSGWWLLGGIVVFLAGSFASAWALAKVLNYRKRPPPHDADSAVNSANNDPPA